MAERVLLLGASGTVGSRVALALLDAGYPLRTLGRTQGHRNLIETRERGAEVRIGDMNDEQALRAAMEGCRWFVHCAAPYPWSGLKFRLNSLLRRWVPQIRRHFEIAGECGIERAVFTSSLSTVGLAPKGALADETMPWNPARQGGGTYYPVKAALEQAVLETTAAGAKGPPTVLVNPTALVGEGSRNPELSAACIFYQGLTPFLCDGRMNFVDCRDVARGHVLALEKGRPGERYVLGGMNTTVRAFAETVTAMAGLSPPWRIPRRMVWLTAWGSELWGVLSGGPGAVSLTSWYHLAYGQHYSSEKAEQELGYRPTQDLASAIQRELRWHAAVKTSYEFPGLTPTT